jgi:hypothetical protein
VLLGDEHHGTEQEEEFGSAGHPAGPAGQTLTPAFQPRPCGELRCPKTLSITLSMFPDIQTIIKNFNWVLKAQGFCI